MDDDGGGGDDEEAIFFFVPEISPGGANTKFRDQLLRGFKNHQPLYLT